MTRRFVLWGAVAGVAVAWRGLHNAEAGLPAEQTFEIFNPE